jgi:hypothetical protein
MRPLPLAPDRALMRSFWAVWPALCVAAVSALPLRAQAPGTPRPREGREFPVTMEVTAARPGADGKQRIVVTLTIKEDHFVFANPPGIEDLVPGQTTLTVTGKSPPRSVKLTYPRGEVVADKLLGDYRIYTGKVRLEALVQRADGDTGPLLVCVRLWPFNRKTHTCNWVPTSLKKSVGP